MNAPDDRTESLEHPAEDAASPAGPADRPRRRGPLVWIIGGLLWVVVIVVAVREFGSREEDKQHAAARKGPAQVHSAAQPSADDIWDPEGLPDFALTERNGKVITKDALKGKPWVVSFFFTRCQGSCPKLTSAMREVYKRLQGLPVQLVSISVDPKYDTPDVLKEYAEIYTRDEEQWYFLTGKQIEIYSLIIDGFKLPVKEITGPDRKPGWEVLHSHSILLVDAAGVVKGKYSVLGPDQEGLPVQQHEIQRLVADVRKMIGERK